MSRLFPLVVVLFVACVPGISREAQEARLHQLCKDPQAAYEKGHNEGMNREPMSTMWIEHYCVPENREQQRTAYTSGYQTGIQYAPSRLDVAYSSARPASYSTYSTYNAYGPTWSTQGATPIAGESCRFSSDCAHGQSCRNDGYGNDVCMGFGRSGDACWFSSDCLSNSCDDKTCR
jgi:hypothetical protein